MGAAITAARGAGLPWEAEMRKAVKPRGRFDPQASVDEAAAGFAAWRAAVGAP
jgi:hypothetical protein